MRWKFDAIRYHTKFVSHRLRNVTVTLEEEVARWARIEAARRNTSVSRLLGALLKENMSAENGLSAKAADRLANFGKRHGLSLRGLKIMDFPCVDSKSRT
jgi:GH35 family endo-1,4-beta-xylanase